MCHYPLLVKRAHCSAHRGQLVQSAATPPGAESTRNSKLETRASEASAGVTERNGEGGAGAQDSRLDGRLARLVGGRTRRGGSHPASGLAPRYQGDLATQSMQPLALLSPSLVLVFFSHRVMRLSSPPPFGRQLLRPTDRRCFLCLPC